MVNLVIIFINGTRNRWKTTGWCFSRLPHPAQENAGQLNWPRPRHCHDRRWWRRTANRKVDTTAEIGEFHSVEIELESFESLTTLKTADGCPSVTARHITRPIRGTSWPTNGCRQSNVQSEQKSLVAKFSSCWHRHWNTDERKELHGDSS